MLKENGSILGFHNDTLPGRYTEPPLSLLQSHPNWSAAVRPLGQQDGRVVAILTGSDTEMYIFLFKSLYAVQPANQ